MAALTLGITLSGLGVTVILGIAAIRRRGGGDRLLGMLLLCMAAQMAANSLIASRQVLEWPHAAQLHVPLAFAIGPLLYAHAQALAGRPLAWRVLALHLIPAGTAAAALLPFYLQTGTAKAAYLESALAAYPTAWRVRQALLLLQLGVYVAMAFRIYLAERQSATFRGALSARLIAVAPVIWIVNAFRYVVAYEADTATIGTAVLAGAIGLFAISKTSWSHIEEKRRTSSTGAEGDACLVALTKLFERDRLFTDRQLTLESLAIAVGTSPHFLSRVVNERTGRTVPDYINAHRVQEAQRLLCEPTEAGTSISAIAERVGFGSRSAFNASFRKHAGTTPGEFRRKDVRIHKAGRPDNS